jgi:hypothetical protein
MYFTENCDKVFFSQKIHSIRRFILGAMKEMPLGHKTENSISLD